VAKKDVEASVGKELMDRASKEIAKSVTKETDPSAVPPELAELNDAIEQATKTANLITISIKRRNRNTGKSQWLGQLQDIPPEIVKEGIEPMILDYSGGGLYEVTYKVPGLPPKIVIYDIAGEEMKPKPEREKEAGIPTSPLGLTPVNPDQGIYRAGPHFGAYMGYGQQQNSNQIGIAEIMALTNAQNQTFAQLVAGMQAQKGSGNDEALEEMKKQNDQLREQLLQQASDTKMLAMQSEFEKRNQEMMAELKSLRETKKTGPDWPALITAATAALGPAVATIGTMASERAKADALRNSETMTMFKAILDSQNNVTPIEERFAKQSAAMMDVMGGFAQAMGLMVNNVIPQSENDPPWLRAIHAGIEGLGGVLEAAFSAGGEYEEGEAPPMMQAPPAQTLPAPDGPVGELEAPEPPQPQEPQVPTIDLNKLDYAIQTVIKILIDPEGDEHDAAYRLWKHSKSPNRIAEEWLAQAEEMTRGILLSLRQSGQADITDERIDECIAAIVEIAGYMEDAEDEGQAALEYIEHYNLKAELPKRVVAQQQATQPAPDGHGSSGTPEFGQPMPMNVQPIQEGAVTIVEPPTNVNLEAPTEHSDPTGALPDREPEPPTSVSEAIGDGDDAAEGEGEEPAGTGEDREAV